MSPGALFVSRAGADADFAAVIGEILESAGHTVVLQQWDFANRNFMERMHSALAGGARVVALLSREYLDSPHCQAEWQNAIADDPLNTASRLILLRVAECEPTGLLSGLAYWDLVPIRDDRALLQEIVLDALREERRGTAPSGPYWRAPRSVVDAEAIRPVSTFSAREEELAAISAGLASDGAIAAVYGLGGVGKTSIAREYAWRNRERYSVVWWLTAQTEDGIIEGLLRLGAIFVRGLDQLADRRAAAQRVIGSVLQGFSKPVLLIFDNLEDERLVRTWLPRTGARALVTSRNAAWGAEVAAIPLHAWEPETAARYLQRESARTDLSEADACAITDALGALPLALSHAAAALRSHRMVTPGRYLERIGDYLKSAPRASEYPQSVFATFNAAIVQAESEAPGAAAALCFAALFAPDAIPDELFRQPVESYGENLRPALSNGASTRDLRSALADEFELDEALGALNRLSLLDFSETARTYAVHRLVQLASQDTIAAETLAWRDCAVAAADAAFPPVEFAAWPECERLLPHARAALEALPDGSAFLPASRLAHRCAVYLWRRAEFRAAELLLMRSLAICERACGPADPGVARALNDLGKVYVDECRYDEAEPLLARALQICENAAAPDPLDRANILNNLAVICREQCRYDDAERLYRRSLEILERGVGEEHPEFGRTLNNLAGVYVDRDDAEAEKVLSRALAVKEKTLGPDHPNVAYTVENLAIVRRNLGNLSEAEALHRRALEIREKTLGVEHPDVALSLHGLANVFGDRARYDEAEALHKRAVAIWEKTLGLDHPYVAHGFSGLALLYREQGRYEEAEPLHLRALAIFENAVGRDHLYVATSLRELARLYSLQGRSDEAETMLARALAIREEALGPDHTLTKSLREDLAGVRQKRVPLKRSS
ncbi:MAG: tetratricopeptide repeat protein [Candidatus Eremiobacteraeota bacterium]|nr:tetratricopeptide repeat protein [Candidatus Eremiobacteraeota bacterium]